MLKIYSGLRPAKCETPANDGSIVLLAETMPIEGMYSLLVDDPRNPEWMTAAIGSGVATFFRIESDDGKCEIQGSVGVDSGELRLDSANIMEGQSIKIRGFDV